jgi:hypothetical protein
VQEFVKTPILEEKYLYILHFAANFFEIFQALQFPNLEKLMFHTERQLIKTSWGLKILLL